MNISLKRHYKLSFELSLNFPLFFSEGSIPPSPPTSPMPSNLPKGGETGKNPTAPHQSSLPIKH